MEYLVLGTLLTHELKWATLLWHLAGDRSIVGSNLCPNPQATFESGLPKMHEKIIYKISAI